MDFPDSTEYLDHISLDCVIFGFHRNELKVLLLKLKEFELYALPGGFLRKDETLEDAAGRVLKERTGLGNIFLKQFRVFSDVNRSEGNPATRLLEKEGADNLLLEFFHKRFITVGFFALVDFTKVNPTPDRISDTCEWKEVKVKESLILDHAWIIQKALEELRTQLRHQPVGYNLLPEKFTMPELQKLYETILGKELDRRNFQRKILSYNILDRLDETRRGGPHKSPYLYTFNVDNYHRSLKEGLRGM